MYLARGWHSTPIFPKNSGVNRGFGPPSRLPSDFPEKLRELAYEASTSELENFQNKSGWTDPEKRIEALKRQINLFS